MTGLTGSCSNNMRRGFRFHISISTTMAGRTAGGDAGVVHRRARKAGGGLVAGLARCGSWNVRSWLA